MGFLPYLLLLFGIQSTLSCDTQHHKKDVSLKKTPRVGSCHFVDIFLNSFQDKHLELVPAMFQSLLGEHMWRDDCITNYCLSILCLCYLLKNKHKF